MVRAFFCCGTRTTRTPADERAAPTGSVDALEELLLLLPHAVRPAAAATSPAPTAARLAPRIPLIPFLPFRSRKDPSCARESYPMRGAVNERGSRAMQYP